MHFYRPASARATPGFHTHPTSGSRRRRRIRWLIAPVAMVLLVVAQPGYGPEPVAAQTALERPNVLIVLTDDQRTGLSSMPDTKRFFRDGTAFPNAVVTTPLCCPSRVSILTGLYAHNHGVHDNQGNNLAGIDHESSLPAYLKGAGYRTAYFGKYINGWPYAHPPYFDEFALQRKGWYYNVEWNVGTADGDREIKTVDTYSTDFLTRQSTSYLNRSESVDDQPWFMTVGLLAPHGPYTPEKRYRGAHVGPWKGNPAVFEKDMSDKPPHYRHKSSFESRHWVRRGQLRTLMSVDDLMARLDRTLSSLGEKKDTLVFFLSDNGFLWGEHGFVGKTVPYTPSVKVPFLMRWPGHTSVRTDPRLVANIDIAPTILDAAGILQKLDKPMDGKSIFSSEPRERILIEWLREDTVAWGSLLTESYQFIEYYMPNRVTPSWREYYDLLFDPHQLESLLGEIVPGETPTWATALSRQLAADSRCKGATCP